MFFPLRRKGEVEKFIVLKNTSGAKGVADRKKEREKETVSLFLGQKSFFHAAS